MNLGVGVCTGVWAGRGGPLWLLGGAGAGSDGPEEMAGRGDWGDDRQVVGDLGLRAKRLDSLKMTCLTLGRGCAYAPSPQIMLGARPFRGVATGGRLVLLVCG